MTTEQIAKFVSLASNELLREIVNGNSPKWKWYRFAARQELEHRDHVATFGA